MRCCACPNCWHGCDDFSSSFFSASAKAAPLNINKVSNSLLNFGRKLIAPAMASGGAVGASAGGSSCLPPAMPIRSAMEAPQHHHQHHQHQAQQQRMMKSESMPVQLGKGKGETCGSAATALSCALRTEESPFVVFILMGTCLEEKEKPEFC